MPEEQVGRAEHEARPSLTLSCSGFQSRVKPVVGSIGADSSAFKIKGKGRGRSLV
ncbi:hypothetical protein SLEP1_g29528 [Rubroshorea leprosula]|uniref:Uncharacterized protein n=1 Tax=Rubroshorea leprosula TaxID=152421 RepID=A0AAV5K768_9ROSI|nr:hypothetical protein SLEP1_g29528 [Rubroshorea leprosula]